MRYPIQFKKCVSFIRNQLETNWDAGTALPTITFLSKKLKVSCPTFRKALQIFERRRIISNFGPGMGFFVTSKNLNKFVISTQALIHLSELHLEASEILNNGGIQILQYIIGRQNENIKIINLALCTRIKTNDIELIGCLECPVQVKEMLLSERKDRERLRTQWSRQKNILEVAKLLRWKGLI